MPVQANSLWSSIRIQARVIGALLLRETLTRYGRNNIGFLWLFLEPMLFTLGVTALWTATRSVHGSNLPIVAFAVTGYSTVLLWRNMPMRTIGALEPNLSLMYHRNVKVDDIYYSRVILESLGATASFMLLSVVFISFGQMHAPEDALLVILGWLLTAWFGASVAVLLGALGAKSDMVEKIWHPLSYLLFPLSGAAFIVEALPAAAKKVVLVLPMVHGVEIVRAGYFGAAFRPTFSVEYLVACNLVLSTLALIQVRDVSKRIQPE